MTSSTNIDTAIATWKAAATQADRDLAATAIREHIAHETPEDADYDSATDELLDRLKAEYGPVPVEDLRGYYIALPAELSENEVEGIWGIGRTADAAIADAHHWTQTQPATVEQDGDKWLVRHERGTERFDDEDEAHEFTENLGYRAEPCTKALYDRVKSEGFHVDGRNSYRYAMNGRLWDVVERDAA